MDNRINVVLTPETKDQILQGVAALKTLMPFLINLSDLRTPKSAELFDALDGLDDDRHSIFSPSRAAELRRALGSGRAPLLRAWGKAKQLSPLVGLALATLKNGPQLGLTDDGIHYRHPLPQRFDLQTRWLLDVSSQLDAWIMGLNH